MSSGKIETYDLATTFEIISKRAEEKFSNWLFLLPEEYHSDVYGVPWPIVLSSIFGGIFVIWIIMWRSGVSNRKKQIERSEQLTKELQTQLEVLAQEKVEKEKSLQQQIIEIEVSNSKLEQVNKEKEDALSETLKLKQTLDAMEAEKNKIKDEHNDLKNTIKSKEQIIEGYIKNSKSLGESAVVQNAKISELEASITKLQSCLKDSDNTKMQLQGNIKSLEEKVKEANKQKNKAQELNSKIKRLENEILESNKNIQQKEEISAQQAQEIDVLKDCLLQFRAIQSELSENNEDIDDEENIRIQKDKLSSMIDVSRIKSEKKLVELQKEQICYELEAEKKSKVESEGRIAEMDLKLQSEQAVKLKLEKDIQNLESKLSVMENFYAKREVEIQGKLGKEQTIRESNESMLAQKQKYEEEMISQLEEYKRMSEDAKAQYIDSERQRKAKNLEYEKKAHENWLACREAERKYEEASREISQLKLELEDMQRRVRDREESRPPLFRPQPKRHGPPPPPFDRSRGSLPSPVHFRNGPPDGDIDRRSVNSERRPQSPGTNSVTDESGRPLTDKRPARPPSRPDRPPSAHSLPPMDRRPPPPHMYGPSPTMGLLERKPPLMSDRGPPPPMRNSRLPQNRPPFMGDREGPPPPFIDGPPSMYGERGPSNLIGSNSRPRYGGPMTEPGMGVTGRPPIRNAPPYLGGRGPPPSMDQRNISYRHHGGDEPKDGPLTSSPYMARPQIPSSQSPVLPVQNNSSTQYRPESQGSLHAQSSSAMYQGSQNNQNQLKTSIDHQNYPNGPPMIPAGNNAANNPFRKAKN